MKKLVAIVILSVSLLSSFCTTQKLAFNKDDVYANPTEDKMEAARAASIQKARNEAISKRYNDSIALVKQAQKLKDDANPYYKDREFKYDDYYDYEYATRVKRFNNDIKGLSYYDNYYTNSYWYNNNPYSYGTSVYNGYSWWGQSYNNYSYNPSVNFYANQGWNCGCGNQYGYNGYNPYMSGYMQGYNNGFNNGVFGNYYGYGNPYGYGMNSYGYGSPYSYGGYGYNNFNNNGWGYYNSYDNNSAYTYGARTSHGGGNSQRTSTPGINTNEDSYYGNYVKSINEKQTHESKFAESRVININSYQTNSPNKINYNTQSVQGMRQKELFNTEDALPVKHTEGALQHYKTVDNTEGTINSSNDNKIIKTKRSTDYNEVNSVKENPSFKQTLDSKSFEVAPQFENPSMNNNSNFPTNPNNGGGGTTTPINSGGSRPR